MTDICDDAPSKPSTASAAGARQWAGLAVLALPTVLLGLDVTLLYLALPALAADLRPTSTQALWIMDIYGFMIAGFLVTMGGLGDRIGRRRLLMLGAAAFGAASLLAAFSTSAEMLIGARAALGVAGATLMPSTLALITNLFTVARQRALAIGLWATMFALGMAAGPVVGGVVLDRFWWGAAFLVAVPTVALLLVLAPLLLPEYRAPRSGPLDLPSVLLSLAAALPLVYGMKELAKEGAGPGALLAAAAGFAFAVLFVRRQRRLDSPLLDLGLFASRGFVAALLILLVGLMGVSGAMLLVTQYLQLVAGFTPLTAGLWMGPPALAMVAAGIAAPLAARRFRPGFVAAAGLAFSAIGYLLLAGLGAPPSGTAVAVGGFALVYLGLGVIAALGTDLVVGAAPPAEAGSASAISETVQELGVALGVALLGSLAALVYRSRMATAAPPALPESASAALAESLWAATAAADLLPAAALEEARAAFLAGMNTVGLLAGLVAAGLAVLAALALRRIPPLGEGRDHQP